MALQPFTWGAGGQQITSPEQAARKRAIAEALIAQSATPGKNWAEGLADVAAALSGTVLEGRVSEAEAAGRERAGGLFSDLAVNQDPNAIIAALTSPDAAWASPAQTSIASALLNSGLERQDPMYQLQLQTAQAELDALRNPAIENPYMNVGGGAVFNQATGEFMQAPDTGAASLPADVQEYNFYAEQTRAAGQEPLPYLDYVQALKGNGLSITTADGTVIQQGGKALTEGQSKDTVYATRAEGALPIIDQFGSELMNPAARAVEGDPTGLLRGQQSPEFQQARQAGKEFLQAILRKDTGAAITPQETEEYGSVYLPVPGDSPVVLEQKRISRKRALEAIKAGLPPQAILAQERALVNTGSVAPAAVEVIDWTDL